MKLTEDIIIHDTLNPKLWKDNKLIPEVRSQIIKIVSYFEDEVDVPLDILDIQVVGSQASFNYTDTSDLDVHLMCNFDSIDAAPEILQALYNAKKTSFNNNTDIEIKGIPVEMYIQDINSMTNSNGIYSVCDNEWIKEPKPITSIKKYDTTEERTMWEQKIQSVLNRNIFGEVKETIDALYLMRLNSIASDGEFSQGNQVFKEIRAEGLLDKLKTAFHNSLSKELSMESLSETYISNGTFVNRFDE